MSLPAPGIVVDRAEMVAQETRDKANDPDAVNVLPAWLHTETPPGPTTRENSRFVGPSAGDLGRLHAATTAVSETGTGCLHFPDPDHTAAGPWVVVEPLDGRLSTVHRGAGTVDVTCDEIAGAVDASLRALSELIQVVLDAARPQHMWYPVDRDDQGVFTTGLTTFSLGRVSMDGAQPIVEFDVATTPATRTDVVENRFEQVAGVTDATFEADVPVAHSSPDEKLRRTAESVAERVLGDWAYEWGPVPTPFSHIPSPDKLALGTGMPGADRCPEATIDECQRLLEGILTGREDPS